MGCFFGDGEGVVSEESVSSTQYTSKLPLENKWEILMEIYAVKKEKQILERRVDLKSI